MRKFLVVFVLFAILSSAPVYSQVLDSLHLTISPNVDQKNLNNSRILKQLELFLKSKNVSLQRNESWLGSDFEKYIYPYLDIYNVESSKYGKYFYQPTLLELKETADPHKYLLKIAFIGHVNSTNENQLKLIYNLVANVDSSQVKFSRYLDYATAKWGDLKFGSVLYKISPLRMANKQQMKRQAKDIAKLCSFLDCKPISITYYSCINPKELFEIKGFDYHPMMYASATGGLADFGHIIFSGNNSDIYTHEIVHIYTNSLFPHINKFVDEGFATYYAGSGIYDYAWHKAKLKKFISENPNFNFADHLDPYEGLYFENETPIPYMIGALVMERTQHLYGKSTVLKLLASEGDLWEILKIVGLTPQNITMELKREL